MGGPFLAVVSTCNPLDLQDREALAAADPERFQYCAEGGAYLNLKGLALDPLPGIDEEKIATLCRVVRGMLFAAVDAAQSGHPGGSTSKAEQVVTLLLSGAFRFDAWNPKHPGRDRLVWSAGHCSPLAHSLVALVYETLRGYGFTLPGDAAGMPVFPEQSGAFSPLGRAQRPRGIRICADGYFDGFLGARLFRRLGLRPPASLLRPRYARVRHRRRRRDRRGHEL